MTRRGWLLFAAMGLIWGIPYLAIRIAVRDVSPPTLVFARTGIAAVLLLPLALRRGQLRPLLGYWRPLLAYTATELAVPWLALSDAERRLSSSLSGLLVAAVPIVGALLAKLSGSGEPFSRRRVAGLVIGLAGVALLLGFATDGVGARPLVEVAVVVICYATGPLIAARALADAPSLGVVAASLGLTAVGYAPIGLLDAPRRLPGASVLAAVAVLAVVCTALAFLLFFPLIREVGAARAVVITYVNPGVAVVLGVAILHEQFTAATGAGFALILAGSVLATGGARRPVPALQPPAAVALTAGEPPG